MVRLLSAIPFGTAVDLCAFWTDTKVRVPLSWRSLRIIRGDFFDGLLVGLEFIDIVPVDWNRRDPVTFVGVAVETGKTNLCFHARASVSRISALAAEWIASWHSRWLVCRNHLSSEFRRAGKPLVASPTRKKKMCMDTSFVKGKKRSENPKNRLRHQLRSGPFGPTLKPWFSSSTDAKGVKERGRFARGREGMVYGVGKMVLHRWPLGSMISRSWILSKKRG